MRSKGVWFEIHQMYCVVSLSKTLYPLAAKYSLAQPRKTEKHSDISEKLLTGINTNKVCKM